MKMYDPEMFSLKIIIVNNKTNNSRFPTCLLTYVLAYLYAQTGKIVSLYQNCADRMAGNQLQYFLVL